MVKKVYYNHLGFLIVFIILRTSQGYPYEQSEELRSTDCEDCSPEVVATNHDKAQLPAVVDRESLDVNNYEPRMKNRANERVNNDSDGKIIFPPDLPAYITMQPKFTPSSVTACKNTTFCENPPFYPEDFIKSALTTRYDLKYLASVDTAPEIGQRIDADDGYESLCGYEEKLVFPKTAENKGKEWLFIVNDDSFRQGVRIETCTTEKTACRVIDGFASGYETSCKQKFIYRQLAAVSPKGSVGADLFRFPASCCCHIKFTGNPLTRSRIGSGEKENLQSPAPRKSVPRDGVETSCTTEKKMKTHQP